MTSYATPADFQRWAGHLGEWDTPVGDALDGLLERAALDVDAFLCWDAPTTGLLRIDVEQLTDFQRLMLGRATALQAAYRLEIGEPELVEGAPRILSMGIGGISFAPSAPDEIGPQVKAALAGAGLNKRTGTAPPPPEPVTPVEVVEPDPEPEPDPDPEDPPVDPVEP